MLRLGVSVPGRATRQRCEAWPRTGPGLAVAALVALLLGGCGSSTHPTRPAVCSLKAQQAVAHDLGIATATIQYTRSEGSNGMPQCAFAARASGHRLLLLVNVDNGPSAYFRLLRTVDEATQIFGPPPPGFHAPVGVLGLGPFASWFVDEHQLKATNDVDLITVSVTWPGARQNAEIRVARAAMVPYLADKHGKKGNDNDYP
jgi:hypothetical protein